MKGKRVALLAVSAALMMTGCQTKKELLNPDDPTTIQVWHYYNGAQQDEFNNLVEKFNKTEGKDKGIIVQAMSQGTISDLETNVLDAINGKAGGR